MSGASSPVIPVPYGARQQRDAERRGLGLSWSEWILFKAWEWTRLTGVPPSAMDWNVPMARKAATPQRLEELAELYSGHLWPSSSTVATKFGSWNGMMAAAGLPALSGGQRRTPVAEQWPVAHARRQRIAALLEAGLDRRAIAEQLGVSRSSVSQDISIMRRRGEPVEQQVVPGPSAAVLEQLATLWRMGAPVQELADAFTDGHPGVLLSHVERCRELYAALPVRDLWVDPAEVPLSPEREQRMQEVARLWRDGLRSEVIAEQVGVARSTVWADISRLRQRGVDLPERPSGRPKLSGPSAPVIARRARVRVLEHSGLSAAAIAERLGVSTATVLTDLRAIAADPGRAA